MVIVEVDREDPFQVALVENHHVVQAIAPDTTDDPLHVRILPRAARSRDHFFDEKTVHAVAKSLTVDSISIAKQMLRCSIPWKGLDHLLPYPLGRRVHRDIEINHLSTVVCKDDENV